VVTINTEYGVFMASVLRLPVQNASLMHVYAHGATWWLTHSPTLPARYPHTYKVSSHWNC